MAENLRDLNITHDELNRIGKALKNKEFRDLLVEYCEELSDPATKKQYEDEITQLEKERGIDVTFIHPSGAYVIKTSANGDKLVFINVCSNEKVEKPTSKTVAKDPTSKGQQWSFPHLISPPRDDISKNGTRCVVYDVIFHPETLYLVSCNKQFRDLINQVSCDAVESNFDVVLDKTNLKFPKLKYKGVGRPVVIRKKCGEVQNSKCQSDESAGEVDKLYTDLYKQMDERYGKFKCKSAKKKKTSRETVSEYATPNYVIKHRTDLDIQDFTYDRDSKMNAAIPKELIIEVNLPLLKSVADLTLDATEKSVKILSEKPAKYKLDLTLPYSVNEEAGSAKFDVDTRKLIVTLPVKRTYVPVDFGRYDSGVDSDSNAVLDSPSDTSLPLVQELESESSDSAPQSAVVSPTSVNYSDPVMGEKSAPVLEIPEVLSKGCLSELCSVSEPQCNLEATSEFCGVDCSNDPINSGKFTHKVVEIPEVPLIGRLSEQCSVSEPQRTSESRSEHQVQEGLVTGLSSEICSVNHGKEPRKILEILEVPQRDQLSELCNVFEPQRSIESRNEDEVQEVLPADPSGEFNNGNRSKESRNGSKSAPKVLEIPEVQQKGCLTELCSGSEPQCTLDSRNEHYMQSAPPADPSRGFCNAKKFKKGSKSEPKFLEISELPLKDRLSKLSNISEPQRALESRSEVLVQEVLPAESPSKFCSFNCSKDPKKNGKSVPQCHSSTKSPEKLENPSILPSSLAGAESLVHPTEELSEKNASRSQNSQSNQDNSVPSKKIPQEVRTDSVNLSSPKGPSKTNSLRAVSESNFLDPDVLYILPEYVCHLFNNTLCFTFYVKNVSNESIQKYIDSTAVHLNFFSVSSGYFPVNYSIYIRLPSPDFSTEANRLSVEAWDNNVTLQIPYRSLSDKNLANYWIGSSQEDSEAKFIEEPPVLNHRYLEAMQQTVEIAKDVEVHLDSDDELTITINPHKSSDEDSGLSNANSSVDLAVDSSGLSIANSSIDLLENSNSSVDLREDSVFDPREKNVQGKNGGEKNRRVKKSSGKNRHPKTGCLSESSADELSTTTDRETGKKGQKAEEQKSEKSSGKTARKNRHQNINKNQSSADETMSNTTEEEEEGVKDGEMDAEKKSPRKSRSLSESSADELSASQSPTKGKSILKGPHSRFFVSRSMSESSVDDYTWSSIENSANTSESLIPEEGEISSSMKKTVRFNDVVSKQLYRSNSSILGQRKKNQRKNRNKKKSAERKLSESENSETEEKRERSESKENGAQAKNKNQSYFKSDLIFDIDI